MEKNDLSSPTVKHEAWMMLFNRSDHASNCDVYLLFIIIQL